MKSMFRGIIDGHPVVTASSNLNGACCVLLGCCSSSIFSSYPHLLAGAMTSKVLQASLIIYYQKPKNLRIDLVSALRPRVLACEFHCGIRLRTMIERPATNKATPNLQHTLHNEYVPTFYYHEVPSVFSIDGRKVGYSWNLPLRSTK
jgi:hypothetical protein